MMEIQNNFKKQNPTCFQETRSFCKSVCRLLTIVSSSSWKDKTGTLHKLVQAVRVLRGEERAIIRECGEGSSWMVGKKLNVSILCDLQILSPFQTFDMTRYTNSYSTFMPI